MSNVPSTFALIGDTFQARTGIWKCWFLRRGENRSTRGKTSWSREENQQQTRPTYDAASGNRTRDTLVGGERCHHSPLYSHHCAIPAPILEEFSFSLWKNLSNNKKYLHVQVLSFITMYRMCHVQCIGMVAQ